MNLFARFILKLVLLLCIACFALVNYRLLSFDNGWSIVEVNGKSTVESESLLRYVPTKIEYYKRPFCNEERCYKVYIVTNEKNFLLDASIEEINALSFVGMLSERLQPQKVTPVPFYAEIILAVVILIVPFGGRKKK